jgi:hypothetical protein
MLRRHRCALTLLATLAPALAAGPLTPPPGVIASTMKSLQEVEPRTPLSAATTPGDSDSIYRITQPGSYYLTGLMTVPSGFNGIEITASNVTLDLMGMTIHGAAGSKDGINNQGLDNTNITILNGTIREMGGDGIHLDRLNPQAARGHRIERVSAINNAGTFGIAISDGTIVACNAHHNAETGIRASGAFMSKAEGCSASNNNNGILVDSGIILNSVADYNTYGGIRVGNHGVIANCSASSNRFGFMGANYHISNSTAADNWEAGIQANVGLTAINNLVISKNLDASTAGFSVSNTGSRIEGNNIVRQGIAIKITGSGNLIIGNTLRGNNAAANIVAGNRVGTLVTTPSMGAVNGNTGGGSLGTTDPNANIIY